MSKLPFIRFGQNFFAPFAADTIPVHQIIELNPLIDCTHTVKHFSGLQDLTVRPVVYCSEDGQFEVLNLRQVLEGANLVRLHPNDIIALTQLTSADDLPIARLYYQTIGHARLFGDLDPLIHAACGGSHLTALLNQVFLQQPPDRPITTEQIERLCGGKFKKSTINARKKALGYTDPRRGCKARQFPAENDPDHDFFEDDLW